MHWGMAHVFWLLPLFWLIVMALLICGAVASLLYRSRASRIRFASSLPHP